VTAQPKPHLKHLPKPTPTPRLSKTTTLATPTVTTMVLAISTTLKKAKRVTMILGTLTMGFSKARTMQRHHLISPQNSLLYLSPRQVL